MNLNISVAFWVCSISGGLFGNLRVSSGDATENLPDSRVVSANGMLSPSPSTGTAAHADPGWDRNNPPCCSGAVLDFIIQTKVYTSTIATKDRTGKFLNAFLVDSNI